jgi:hypothetical protein
MGDIDISLNALCTYMRKYRIEIQNRQTKQSSVSYNDFKQATLGSFKGKTKYKQSSECIISIINNTNDLVNKEFTIENLSKILLCLFMQADHNKISDAAFLILSDLVDGIKFGSASIALVGDDKEKLLKLKNELLDKFNDNMNSIETSGIIDETQTQNHSNNQQQQNEQQAMRIVETQVPQSVNNPTVNVSVNDLSIMIRQIIKEEVKNTNNSTTTEHIINEKKPLTRVAFTELRQSIYFRYEKLMKLENTISIFKSHLENNTVPFALSYVKFPKPLWVDDPIFVDAHNEVIRNAQKQMVVEIITRGKAVIDCLNVELAELRSQLDQTYEGNKDKFFDNIKASVTNSLKPFFEASNAKLLRLQNNYFEDQINTVYEVQDKSSDNYINQYLQLDNNSSKSEIDSQLDTVHKPKLNNNDESLKKPKKRNHRNNYRSNQNQNDNYNNPNKNNAQYLQDSNTTNTNINNNWRDNMQNTRGYNSSNWHNNQQQQKNFDKNQNFRMAQNQNKNS